jgi:hypothetical protein
MADDCKRIAAFCVAGVICLIGTGLLLTTGYMTLFSMDYVSPARITLAVLSLLSGVALLWAALVLFLQIRSCHIDAEPAAGEDEKMALARENMALLRLLCQNQRNKGRWAVIHGHDPAHVFDTEDDAMAYFYTLSYDSESPPPIVGRIGGDKIGALSESVPLLNPADRPSFPV